MSAGEPVRRRRILVVVNPTAGRSRHTRRCVRRVVAALKRRGCVVELRSSEMRDGVVEYVPRGMEEAFDVVVAAGGDGTINAIANGLAGARRPLALLPFGTANVLAHNVGLPSQPDALAELIVAGPVRPIWPGRIGDRLFLTMASAGFDAETVATVNFRLKRHLGRAAFAWAILLRLVSYRPVELTVRADGVEYQASAVIATRGRCYAGPYVIAPTADPAEPVLDLLLFQRSGRRAVVRYLALLLLGRLPRCDDVLLLRVREVVVTAAGSVPVQADGEPMGALPVTFGIAARPLPLIRP